MRAWLTTVLLTFSLTGDLAYAHLDPEISGYIQVDGGRIWYRLNGTEHIGKTPAIIVAHGGPGGHHRANMPYMALSNKYPVILYDQLGSGNSDRPGLKENWNVERFVAEIDYIRKTLKLDEMIIAGHSWGGTLAAEYAVRRPDGLKAVILSSPLISTPQWNEDNQLLINQLPDNIKKNLLLHEAEKTINHPDYKSAVQEFYRRHMCRKNPCSDQHYSADAPSFNKVMYLTMWGPSDFRGVGTLKNYDISPRLKNIEVPTLMICGEYDEAVPSSCKEFSNMIEKSTTIIVPDAGHLTLLESEEFYIETVRNFLENSLK